MMATLSDGTTVVGTPEEIAELLKIINAPPKTYMSTGSGDTAVGEE